MPRDGQGGYVPPLNNWNPALDGNEADPASWNQLLADISAALSQSVSSDGQTMLTGNLKMGGNTLQGMGASSANGQALRRDQLTKGPNIESASTITIPAEGSVFEVTGTTTINQMSGAFDGRMVVLVFQDELIIKHGPNLQLPNATDITTRAGDAFVFYRKSSSEWAALFRTAAYADIGTGPDDVPTNDDLGSAASLDVATTEQAEDLIDDDAVITPKNLGDAMNAHVLGMGQTWQNMTSSRSIGTNYTNTSGRAIAVAVTLASSLGFACQLNLDTPAGRLAYNVGPGSASGTGVGSAVFGVIPPGGVYWIGSEGFADRTLTWMELRS